MQDQDIVMVTANRTISRTLSIAPLFLWAITRGARMERYRVAEFQGYTVTEFQGYRFRVSGSKWFRLRRGSAWFKVTDFKLPVQYGSRWFNVVQDSLRLQIIVIRDV